MPKSSASVHRLPRLAVFIFSSLARAWALTPEEAAAALDSGNDVMWEAAPTHWKITTGPAALDGVDSLRVGPGVSSQPRLTGTVVGPGVLRWRWKTSSEEVHDRLEFRLNAIPVKSVSGESGPVAEEVPIPFGTHQVTFAWITDAQTSLGEDSGWIDAVTLVPAQRTSLAEALDLPASTNVTMADSSPPWTAIADASRSLQGGDVVYLAPPSWKEKAPSLRIPVAGPALMSFRWRWEFPPPAGLAFSEGLAAPFRVTGARVLDSGQSSGDEWAKTLLFVPEGAATIQITQKAGITSQHYVLTGTGGFLLDDWQVEPLQGVTAGEALDAGGLAWSISGPQPAWQGWSGGGWMRMPATPGSNDLLAALGDENDTSGGLPRVISTTVTGPGRLTAWRRTIKSPSVPASAAAIPGPDWVRQTQEVPAGQRQVAWSLASSQVTSLIDGVVWEPETWQNISATEAADVTGNVTLQLSDGWRGVAAPRAGLADNDALVFLDLTEHSQFPPMASLRATAQSTGWLSASWGSDHFSGAFSPQSGETRPEPAPSQHHQRTWTTEVVRVSATPHVMEWIPPQTQAAGRDLRVDAISLLPEPPAWWQALGAEAFDRGRMHPAPWPVETTAGPQPRTSLRTPGIQNDDTATLELEVVGPGEVSFWWKTSSQAKNEIADIAGDVFHFGEGELGPEYRFQWIAPATLSGESGWQRVVRPLPEARRYLLRWAYIKDNARSEGADAAWLDEVLFQPTAPVSLAEALDAPAGIVVTASGNPAWRGLALGAAAALDGDMAVLDDAPREVDGGVSTLTATLPAAGAYSFKVKNLGAAVEIRLDGQPVDWVSAPGEDGWISVTGNAAGPGAHQLEWTYRAQPSSTRAWIAVDALQFTPQPAHVTLAQALDVEGIDIGDGGTWMEHGGMWPARQDAALARDGADLLVLEWEPQGTFAASMPLKLTGPCRVSFWWKLESHSSDGFYAHAAWAHTLAPPSWDWEEAGPFDWRQATLTVPDTGSVELLLGLHHSGGTSEYWQKPRLLIDQMEVLPLQEIPLGEATGAPGFAWTTGGTLPWKGVAGAAMANARKPAAIAASPAAVGSQTWLETTITGPGKLYFDLQAPSIHNNIETKTFRNGVETAKIWDWTEEPYLEIPPGPQVVRWVVTRVGAGMPEAIMPAVRLENVHYRPSIPLTEAVGSPAHLTIAPVPPDAQASGYWSGVASDKVRGGVEPVPPYRALAVGRAAMDVTVAGPGMLEFFAAARLQPASFIWAVDGMVQPAPDARVGDLFQLNIAPGQHVIRLTANDRTHFEGMKFRPYLNPAEMADALGLAPGTPVTLAPAPNATAVSLPGAAGGTGLKMEFPQRLQDPAAVLSFPVAGPAWVSYSHYKNGDFPSSYWQTSRGSGYFSARINGAEAVDGWMTTGGSGNWERYVVPVLGNGNLSFGFELSLRSLFGEPQHGLLPHVAILDEMQVTPMETVPLAEALEWGDALWTTGDAAVWTGAKGADFSADGVDSALALIPVGASGAAFTLSVTGPGVFSASFDQAEAMLTQAVDGVRVSSTGEAIWVPEGTHQLSILVRNRTDRPRFAWLDQLRWQPSAAVPLAEALPLPPGGAVSTGGASGAQWGGQMTPWLAFADKAAVFRGSLDAGPAWLQTSVTGPAVVRFWWGIQPSRSAPPAKESLTLSLDGQVLREKEPSYNSLGAAHERMEIFVPTGVHDLRWTVQQANSITAGPRPPIAYVAGFESVPLSAAASLGGALEQPSLSWDLSSAIGFPPGAAWQGAGLGLADNDGVLLTPGTALQTAINGPAVIVSRIMPLMGMGCWPAVQGGASGSRTITDGTRASCWLPQAGPGIVRWEAGRDSCAGWVDEVAVFPAVSLAEALDAPSLAWTASDPTAWVGYPGDFGDAAGSHAEAVAPGWLECEVQGPGRLHFDAFSLTSSASFLSVHTLEVNGKPFELSLAPKHENERAHTVVLPAGPHRVRWVRHSATQAMALDAVRFVPSTEVDPVTEALDAPNEIVLLRHSASDWTLDASASYDGQDSLLPNDEAGWVTLSVAAPARVSYFESTLEGFGRGWMMRAQNFTDFEPKELLLASFGPLGDGAPPRFDRLRIDPVPSAALGDAMDAPEFPWSASSEQDVRGFVTPLTYGMTIPDAITSDYVLLRRGSALQVTLPGPGTARFKAVERGYQLRLDGALIRPQPFGPSEDRVVHLEITGPGPHTLRWEHLPSVPDAGPQVRLDQFAFLPQETSAPTLAQALGHPGPWQADPALVSTTTIPGQNGDASRQISFVRAYQDSQQPGVQEGVLAATFAGPGRLRALVRFQAAPFHAGRLPEGLPPQVILSPGGYAIPLPLTAGWSEFAVEGIGAGASNISWSGGTAAYSDGLELDSISFEPYASADLAQSLEAAGLSIENAAASGWSGWLAGPGASDGTDAALAQSGTGEGLKMTLPPGRGQIVFYARSYAGSAANVQIYLGQQRAAYLGLTRQYKRFAVPVSPEQPREARLVAGANFSAAESVWLDQLAFVPAADSFVEWATAAGLTGSSAQALASRDEDRDGVPLLLEYALGLDPAAFDRVPTDGTAYGLPRFTLTPHANGRTAALRCEVVVHSARAPLRLRAQATATLAPDGADAWQDLPTFREQEIDSVRRLLIWTGTVPFEPGRPCFGRMKADLD